MTVEIAPRVDLDLDDIVSHIADRSTAHAALLLQKIYAEIAVISRSPLVYQLRPDIGRNARAGVVGRHVILFRVIGSRIRIERVVHGHRQLSSLYLEALRNG